MNNLSKSALSKWFQNLQHEICHGLEAVDGGGKFIEDKWQRPGGGGGRTRSFAKGNVIEKGGVNFSEVYGNTPQKILDALSLEQADFYATGVSIVLHPENPMVPIIHMNIRYFEMTPSKSKTKHWWFGGGIDLTPHYIDPADAGFFHKQLKDVCDRHHHSYYHKFKRWADDYFFLKHRDETRGIGGIFFDRLSSDDAFTKAERWKFVQDVGLIFMPTYRDLIARNKDKPYGEREKQWQFYRRGRYVEFNLVWDKGTKFGLDTGGRTESILMSLPPQANWSYNFHPGEGTPEHQTLQKLKKDINWIDAGNT
ncbi:MAG: coproporphyrinogen oxidase [Cyclobacteriaceae bacterium]|nr:MAG: coproporphyrinogen oxidase [Cyclobacteriaceae bacterium]